MKQNRLLFCYSLILILAKTPGETATGHCDLPLDWHGHWFESGVRTGVNITNISLSHKGTCVRKLRHSSQYIFKHSQENCFRCLSIHEKHYNILQYKESKCVQSDRNYKEICRSISVDEPLKTLFRVDSIPEKCPITGPHTFSYSRGHGECADPVSSLSDCGSGGLLFRYQACPDIKGSESATHSAQCIARWKEGSTYYFVARMSSEHVTIEDYEQSFRCFVYQTQYSGYLLSQSGEAKCNLYTAHEGHTTLKLKKLIPEEECEYPEWFRHHRKYLSLDMSTTFHFNFRGTVLSLRGGEYGVERELQCARSVPINNNTHRIVAISTSNCESGYQCLEVEEVSRGGLLRVKVGRLSSKPEEACDTQLFFSNVQPIIITSAHLKQQNCPFSGQYRVLSSGAVTAGQPVLSVLTPGGDCPVLLSSCSNSNAMSLTSQCAKQSTQDLLCHDSWEENGAVSVVLSEASHRTQRNCLQVKKSPDNVTIELRSGCGGTGGDFNLNDNNQGTDFVLKYHGDCSPTALATANHGQIDRPVMLLLIFAAAVMLSTWK